MENRGRAGVLSVACVRSVMWLSSVVMALPLMDQAFADAQEPDTSRVAFSIPAQSVPGALSEFARQARAQLFFISTEFENIEANALFGSYPAQEGLDLLLAGTGLAGSYSADSGIKVTPVTNPIGGSVFNSQFIAASSDPASNENGPQSDRGQSHQPGQSGTGPARSSLEQIVVTGTSISGVIPESTPLTIYTAADIRNTGALTVESFINTLPQNNGTLTEIVAGVSSRETNFTAVSSADLRGLGVGTTLVLLNGRRLAPASNGRTPDLSMIPISAVERVEVLTDGASAIYGADAIGGVINFVLKDQQDDAETVLTYGGADGGGNTLRVDQSFGFNWAGGNALLILSHMDRNELEAAERDFARGAAPTTLVPADTRRSLLATASQRLTPGLTISGDLLYSTREPSTVTRQGLAERVLESQIDHEQTVLNLEASYPFSEKVNASLLLTFAESNVDEETIRKLFDGTTSGPAFRAEDTKVVDVTAKLDGELASFRSNTVMYALGAGYSEDEFGNRSDTTSRGGSISTTALSRSTRYAFAELLVPLVSEGQGISGIRRLELTLAARHTNYSDFGDNTSPKAGILWSPIAPLILRGTYGESYKAPDLFQLDPLGGTYALFPQTALGFPDIWTPDGSAVVLFAQGPGSPTLGAEKARTHTLGFDLNLSNLSISTTYFKIDYTDRIAEPDPSGGFTVLGSPQDFPELLELNPTLEQVTQLVATSTPFFNRTGVDIGNPVAVHDATTVFFDNRIQNLSITEMDGLDIALGYSAEAQSGELSFGIQASRVFGYTERATRNSPAVSLVDTVLFPADLKARGYIGFRKSGWNTRLNMNYVDEYTNPFAVASQTVDAWTTLDMLLSYSFPADGNRWLTGSRLAFAVRNVLDEDPPFVAVGVTTNTSILEPVGFDPANASPLGRFISLQITKEW